MQPVELVIGICAVLFAGFILITVQAAKVLIQTFVIDFVGHLHFSFIEDDSLLQRALPTGDKPLSHGQKP
jgi:hypothetical protein